MKMENGKEDHQMPEHPLPEEIRKMKRDETVCKFCGVSYLIHNEIKALEDKLRAIQEELKHYKGCGEREEQLRKELAKLEVTVEDQGKTITSKDAFIETLKADLNTRNEEVATLEKIRTELNEKLSSAEQANRDKEEKLNLFKEKLPAIQNSLRSTKQNLQDVQGKMKEQSQNINSTCAAIYSFLQENVVKSNRDLEKLQQQLSTVQAQNQELSVSNTGLKEKLSQSEQRLGTALEQAQQAQIMTQRCKEQEKVIQGLRSDLEESQKRQRTIVMEGVEKEEMQSKQLKEMEKRLQYFHERETQNEERMSRLKQELHTKNRSIEEMKEQLEKMKREDEVLRRNQNSLDDRREEMAAELDRVRGDLEALKSEREMMIEAHQNQIEQLRESFKQKISQADRWPQKLEEALKNERAKHKRDIEQFEAKLKENFVMELQIEKQKHQELFEKYQAEFKQKEAKIRAELKGTISKDELANLHKQLAETKARARETENALRNEIESLKAIIKDLENRLGKLDVGNEMALADLRNQLREKENELTEAKEDGKKLSKELATSREEIVFLQETVRRECEERFELTEALSEAREELLAIKKPRGGYSNTQVTSPLRTAAEEPPGPRSPSSNSRSGSGSSEAVMLYKRASSAKGGSANSQNRETPTSAKDVILQSSVNFNGDHAPTPGRLRGSTLSESRKRIAQAMGRK